MKNVTTQSIRRIRDLALLPILIAVASGCSQVVDNPPTPAPEYNVANYYLHLGTVNAEYDYTVTSTAPYHPASGQLAMSMQGASDTIIGMPVYACLWSYSNNFGKPELWYYCLCDTEAAEMGLETAPENYTDSWVDLKADSTSPLQKNATWSFVSQGEPITAKVTQYGATAQVEGKTYDNVIMVQYTGTNGTSGTEWFSKGIGPIFSHIERNFGMVENHLLSIKQP